MKVFYTKILLVLVLNFSNLLFSQDEIYGIWEKLPPMNSVTEGRSTLLKSGKVLVAGNNSYCELFDPETEQWTMTDSMKSTRVGHVLITLSDGRALVMGGQNRAHNEIYDELSGEWSDGAFFNLGPRSGGQSVLLDDGSVLYIGGQLDGAVTKSCEIYFPTEDRWVITDSLNYPRELHKATVLQNGKVLVTGGRLDTGLGLLNSAEFYDPSVQKWTEVSEMFEKHAQHDALLLTDNRVMVLGGDYNNNSTHCEIYDAEKNEWIQVENIMPGCSVNRGGAILHNDSTILIIDASDWGLYNTNTLSPIGFFYTRNYNLSKKPMIEMLENNQVITMGGWLSKDVAYRPAHEAEIFRPGVINKIQSLLVRSPSITLNQNYPNPFNPSTKISFSIQQSDYVILEVYDTAGKKIDTLVEGILPAGIHNIEFNAAQLPSGLFMYKIKTSNFTESKKMLHLK